MDEDLLVKHINLSVAGKINKWIQLFFSSNRSCYKLLLLKNTFPIIINAWWLCGKEVRLILRRCYFKMWFYRKVKISDPGKSAKLYAMLPFLKLNVNIYSIYCSGLPLVWLWLDSQRRHQDEQVAGGGGLTLVSVLVKPQGCQGERCLNVAIACSSIVINSWTNTIIMWIVSDSKQTIVSLYSHKTW